MAGSRAKFARGQQSVRGPHKSARSNLILKEGRTKQGVLERSRKAGQTKEGDELRPLKAGG